MPVINIFAHSICLNIFESLPFFKDLKLLRIVDIFKLRLLSFVYESVNMVAPDFFHSFFSLSSTVHCHNTRQSTRDDLFLANINTSQYGSKSIRYLGKNYGMNYPNFSIKICSQKVSKTSFLKCIVIAMELALQLTVLVMQIFEYPMC